MIDLKKYIEFGRQNGAEEIEIYLEKVNSTKLQLFKGEVESLLSSQGLGVAVRAFARGKVGFCYTSDLSDTGLKAVVTEAIANAEISGVKEKRELPELYKSYPEIDIYRAEFKNVPIEKKIEFAKAIEKAALAYDKKIAMVNTVGYQDKEIEIYLVNSKGFDRSYQITEVYGYTFAIAKEGEVSQTGLAAGYGRILSELDAKAIGESAARDAVMLLGGKPVPSQKVPVLFTAYTGAQLFAAFVPAFLGEKVQKGKSLFKGKLNQQVANAKVTLIDDGLNTLGMEPAPFDAEGVPSQRTVVVENGLLKAYLYDSNSAKVDGVKSTGNARKASFKELPEASPTNFYLQPGNVTLQEMIAGIKEGFLIMDLTGVHSGTNAVSGDFSVGASGLWIKDGKTVQAVREVTIAGNFAQMLKDISEIGSDLAFSPMIDHMGSPAYLVKELAVSGS